MQISGEKLFDFIVECISLKKEDNNNEKQNSL